MEKGAELAVSLPLDLIMNVKLQPRPTDEPDIVAYVAGYPIAESTACTPGIIGERFAHVANVAGVRSVHPCCYVDS